MNNEEMFVLKRKEVETSKTRNDGRLPKAPTSKQKLFRRH
jgi:hypothetical protein